MLRSACRAGRSVLALGLLITATPSGAWDLGCRHSAERRTSLDTAGAARIVVDARAGDLEVAPANGTVANAHGKACAMSEAGLAKTNVVAHREGDAVVIDVQMPDEGDGFGSSHATLDLVVELPAALPVELNDSSGDIDARDVSIAKLTDSSGDMILTRLKSDVEIWDSSGDVRIEEAAGRVQVRDSSGDVVVHGAAEVVIPVDSSGDIEVERVTGDVRIDQDSSGDIRIADVGHNVTVGGDSSGEVKVSRVQGAVKLP
jgi:hypothetical protein